MARFLTILISIVLSTSAFAQKITPPVIDLGKVKYWNNPILTYTFTNTSSQTILFLPIGYKPNYKLNLPVKKVEPGQSVDIQLQYFTEDLGRFSIKVPVYISTSKRPVYLELKGLIQSLHPDALTVCPSVDGPSIPPTTRTTVLVVDESTGQRLDHFNVLITGPDKTLAYSSGRKDYLLLKDIPVNLYHFEAIKTGYVSTHRTIYSGRNRTQIILPVKRDTSYIEEEEETVLAENTTEEEETKTGPDLTERIEKGTEELSEKWAENRKEIKRRLEERRQRRDSIEQSKQEEVVVSTPDDETVAEPEPEYDKMEDLNEKGELNQAKYADNNLVFLIDISGSMKNEERLPLLKEAMKDMVAVLRPQDHVSIITYSTKSEIVLSSIPGNQKDLIYRVIDSLKAKGQSYGSDGVDKAYQLAKENFIPGGNNEVILASDGMFNSPDFSERKLFRKVRKKASDENIILSAIAFGRSTKANAFMKNLSKNGSGSYLKIESETESAVVLIRNIQEHSYKGK
jgi:Ca-activated chloride channel family protein